MRPSVPNIVSATPLRCYIRFYWKLCSFLAMKICVRFWILNQSILKELTPFRLRISKVPYKKLVSAQLIFLKLGSFYLLCMEMCRWFGILYSTIHSWVTFFWTKKFHIKSVSPQLLLDVSSGFLETLWAFLLWYKAVRVVGGGRGWVIHFWRCYDPLLVGRAPFYEWRTVLDLNIATIQKKIQ